MCRHDMRIKLCTIYYCCSVYKSNVLFSSVCDDGMFQVHVKRGEHMKAARLLIRVANSISQFPSRK